MISDIQKRARQTGLDIIYVCSLFAEYTGILGDSKTDNPKQYQCGCELPGSFMCEITSRFYTQAHYC